MPRKFRQSILPVRGFLAFQILYELRKNRYCGDDLAEILGKKKGGKLTPGTIYPTLKLLRRKKLLQRTRTGRKKVYMLTPLGKKEYLRLRVLFLHLFKDIIENS